jgi:hypothetical protein
MMRNDISINKSDDIIEIKTGISAWSKLGPSSFANAIAKLDINPDDVTLIEEIFSETADRERYFLYNFFSINITHKNLDLPWDILRYPQE